MWSAFEKEITYLQLSGNVMVTGDLNARTGEMDSGINLTFPQQYNIVDSTIEPRSSMDPVVNRCGHTLLCTPIHLLMSLSLCQNGKPSNLPSEYRNLRMKLPYFGHPRLSRIQLPKKT